MSSNQNKPTHSLPIPIDGHRRSRSESVSDCSSDSASTSPASPLPTPLSGTIPLPRIVPISPSTSPILSYLLSQSPKSPPSTFPFRRGISGAIFQEEDAIEPEKPTARHGRRASAAAWPAGDRFPQITPVPPTVPAPHQDRAAGLLRRLSLGGSLTRPPVPVHKPANLPPQAPRATTPPGIKSGATPARKARRANTMAPGTPRPPRAPSPMGERILKGHFDGFN